MDKARRTALAGAAALVIALVIAPRGSAIDPVDTRRSRKGVTVGGVLEHERVFQRIANNNGGTRASGTPDTTPRPITSSAALAEGRLQGPPARVRVPVLPRAGSSDAVPGCRRLRPTTRRRDDRVLRKR